jgi:hypothetical protein
MPEQSPPTGHGDVGYETSDAGLGPLVAMGAGIVLMGLRAHGISLWMFDELRAETNQRDPRLPALAAKERPKLPKDLSKVPAPRLQVDEAKDLSDFRKIEDQQLDSYGWIDPKAGKVHIPIEQAMRLLVDPEKAKAHGIKVAPAKGPRQGGNP